MVCRPLMEPFAAVREAAETLGKVFIEGRDMPGFIVNRILMPMINEACYALYEGIGEVEGIDQAMMLGTNQPMGPLTPCRFYWFRYLSCDHECSSRGAR